MNYEFISQLIPFTVSVFAFYRKLIQADFFQFDHYAHILSHIIILYYIHTDTVYFHTINITTDNHFMEVMTRTILVDNLSYSQIISAEPRTFEYVNRRRSAPYIESSMHRIRMYAF